jgi:hypothetical protein
MRPSVRILRIAFVFILINLCVVLAVKAQYYVKLVRGTDTEHLYDDHAVHEVYDFYVRCYLDAACTQQVNFPSDMTVDMTSGYTIEASWGNYSSGPSTSTYGAGMGDSEIEMHSFAVHLADYSPDYYTFDFYIAAIPNSTYSYDPNITYTVVQ